MPFAFPVHAVQTGVGQGNLDLLPESSKAADYAMRLNLTVQINLVNGAQVRMSVGGRIVFVTSHLAHSYEPGHSPLAFHADMAIHIQCQD